MTDADPTTKRVPSAGFIDTEGRSHVTHYEDVRMKARDRWEYTTIVQTDDVERNMNLLNAVGADGWELIHVGRLSYLLKRRIVTND